jgi:hypothetical protein
MTTRLNDLFIRWNRLAAAAASLVTALFFDAPAQAADLSLVRIGRDIAFVDLGGIVRDGDRRELRVLRVLEKDTEIAGETYLGSWQTLRVDCRARTVSDGPYTALRADGRPGPPSGAFSSFRPWPGDSVEKAAARTACSKRRSRVQAHDVAAAVAVGRQALNQAFPP